MTSNMPSEVYLVSHSSDLDDWSWVICKYWPRSSYLGPRVNFQVALFASSAEELLLQAAVRGIDVCKVVPHHFNSYNWSWTGFLDAVKTFDSVEDEIEKSKAMAEKKQ